jgi:long-chain acyl-CoA synthetase
VFKLFSFLIIGICLKLKEFSSISVMLSYLASRYPKKVAVQIYHDENDRFAQLTYSELEQRARLESDKLKALGIEPGDRVALIEDNSIQWVIAFFAILKCQATAVLLDPRMETSDYDRLIGLSDPQAVIIKESLIGKMPRSLTNCLNFLNVHEGLNSLNGIKPITHSRDGDGDIALLMFTSGTAGHSKAVMLEHKALLSSITIAADVSKIRSKDQYLSMLPLTHIYGLNTFLVSISQGVTTTLIVKFQSDLMLKIMRKTGTTLFGTVPRVLELFQTKIEQKLEGRVLVKWLRGICTVVRDKTGFNIGKWFFSAIHRPFGGCKHFISGGAALNAHVQAKLHSLGFSVIQGYGLTETSARVVGTSAKDSAQGTSGRPDKGVKLRIEPIPGHLDGEICVQSSSLMRGYFRDPVATEEAIKEGWFHTGDLGRLDDQGRLTITGRLKEIIVTSSGLKAMPLDIEERYKGLSGVHEMAVVGMPIGNGLSDEIHAAVIPSEEILKKNLPPEEIKERLKQEIMSRSPQVPTHLRINKVHVVSTLPKTLTLKIKRDDLRNQLRGIIKKERHKATSGENHDDITRDLLKIICQVSSEHGKEINSLNFGMSFELDLHFDSLTSLECVFAIEEHFHIRIKQPDMLKTIGDADQLVRQLMSAASAEEKKVVPFHHELSQDRPMTAQDQEFVEDQSSVVQSMIFATLGMIYRTCFRLEVEGKEHIPEGPFILCSNHTSHLDTPALILASGLDVKTFRVLAAEDYFFKKAWLRHSIKNLLNLVPFSRTNNKNEIIRNFDIARKCIQNKKSIILFPEGTRSQDGALKDFKSFIGILGFELKVPVVPAYIQGAFECWPKGQGIPKRGKIRVIFGKPFVITDEDKEKESTDFSVYAAFTERIHDAVEVLSKE